MTIKINNEEYNCSSYSVTTTSLKMNGVVTEEGTTDIELKGVNWSAIELPEGYSAEPSLEEQIAALKEENLLIQNAIKEMILW